MWGQTLRDWASTSLSELAPLDGHGRSFGAYLHLGDERPMRNLLNGRPCASHRGLHLRAGSRTHSGGCFSHTEMCDGLVEVNGSRVQVAQRSLSVMPACRAMRSSSEGDTYL